MILLADDVGLGKTISAGLIVSELIARGRVSKFLVVCPKLLMPQWREELDVKFGIPAKEVVGKDLISAKHSDYMILCNICIRFGETFMVLKKKKLMKRIRLLNYFVGRIGSGLAFCVSFITQNARPDPHSLHSMNALFH